jgi:hypothetical protein
LLLTIIVPTNKTDYLFTMMSFFCEWNPDNVELLISINGEKAKEVYSTLFTQLPTMKNENLVIHNSNTTNSIECLSATIPIARGEYLVFIGNDDLFMTDIVEYTEFASNNHIDAIRYPLKYVHFWPDTISKESKTIILRNSSYEGIYRTDKYISKLFKNAGQNYRDLPLVNLYHGIVKRSRVLEISNSAGRLVGGFSPDIYFAYTLSKIIGKVYCVDRPLTISGIGKSSASNSSLNKNHQGDLNTSPIASYSDLYWWDINLPRFYSVETVWSATLLIADRDINGNNIINFDYDLLWVLVYINNKLFRSIVSFEEIITYLSLGVILKLGKL